MGGESRRSVLKVVGAGARSAVGAAVEGVRVRRGLVRFEDIK